jgi:hypothetical protein
MADEAYRAVFLRVHPTGKMVLSLTTVADGNESRYAELVGAIASTTEKLRAKAQLLAGAALETPADGLRWDDGAFVGTAGSQTIADLALYAHGTGALPPGVEGGLDAQTVYREEA